MVGQVLIVDDEPGIVEALQRMLRHTDLEVFGASNGEDALAILRQQSINMMVTDHHMPGMDGVTLCQLVQQQYPNTYRLLLSGQIDYQKLQNAWEQGLIHRFVARPWDNLLLTKDILDGVQQQALLTKSSQIQHLIQHNLLLTDRNWIIRLASRQICELLQTSEQELLVRICFLLN